MGRVPRHGDTCPLVDYSIDFLFHASKFVTRHHSVSTSFERSRFSLDPASASKRKTKTLKKKSFIDPLGRRLVLTPISSFRSFFPVRDNVNMITEENGASISHHFNKERHPVRKSWWTFQKEGCRPQCYVPSLAQESENERQRNEERRIWATDGNRK